MARSAVLDVKVLVDAASAAAGLNQTVGQFESFSKKAIAAVGAAFAVDKIIGGVKSMVEAASDMEQAVGGTNLIFKESAGTIHAWAKDTSDDFRVPAREAEKFAAQLGNALIQSGFTTQKAAEMTKQLGQVGADLAAAFGGDTVDAVEAIASAIAKGEWERLESFGVTVKAADVAAEAAALSVGDLAGQSDELIQTQAKINVLMREAAPAMGAAASESQSFSARVDALKEKFDNMLGVVGAPLLDAFGGFADVLGEGVGILTPAAAAVSDFVVAISALPSPMLAAAAGLVAIAFAAGPISAALAKASAAMLLFREQMAVQGALAAMNGTSTAVSGVAGALGVAAIRARAFGAAMLAAVGGGPGLAVAAVIAAIGLALFHFVGEAADAERAAKDVEEAVRSMADVAARSGSDVDYATNALAELNKEGQFKGFESGSKLAADLGLSLGDLTDGMVGVEGATAKVTAAFDAKIAALEAEQQASGQVIDGAFVMNSALGDQINVLEANKNKYLELTGAKNNGIKLQEEEAAAIAQSTGQTVEQVKATNDAAVSQKELADALKEAQKVADSSAIETMFTDAKFQAESASRAVDAVRLSMEALDDRFKDEDARVAWQRGLQDGLVTLQDFRREAEEAEKPNPFNVEALRDWNVEALQADKANQELYDTLSSQADLYPDLVGGAFLAAGGMTNLAGATTAAQDAANKARADFITLAESAGLTNEEAGALATKLGILDAQQISPKLFEVLAQDEQARAAVLAIQQQQIGAKNFEITAGADGAIGTVDDLISYTDAAGNAMPPVPITADATPAEGEADAFTGEKRQTNEVAILANSSPARNAMNAFLSDFSKMTLTATLNANTSPARNAMNAFASEYSGFSVTATILGNSGPARSAINALTAGSYTATVVIRADTSAFMSAFNSLPGSKSVSVAPASVTVAAAPSLMRSSRAASGPPVAPVTINISGGLDSADTIARRVKNVMLGRDRRTGGVVVGEMRSRVGTST